MRFLLTSAIAAGACSDVLAVRSAAGRAVFGFRHVRRVAESGAAHRIGLLRRPGRGWGLKFPRGVLPLKNGTVLVAEMIGWGAKSGRITALVPDGKGRYTKEADPEGP